MMVVGCASRCTTAASSGQEAAPVQLSCEMQGLCNAFVSCAVCYCALVTFRGIGTTHLAKTQVPDHADWALRVVAT